MKRPASPSSALESPPNALPELTGAAAGSLSPTCAIPDHELLKPIGRGSYGEVWLARNVFGELRAVKIIWRREFGDDARPFQREFEGIQRFEPISRSHPSQLAILHVGKNEAAGCFYCVMELADALGERDGVGKGGDGDLVLGSGKTVSKDPKTKIPDPRPSRYAPLTLRSDLKHHGALPIERVLEIGLALTIALAHLHAQKLVHRDIKPSNIIFVGGRPKLADIGLVTDAAVGDDTCSIVGTEGYLAPEGPGTPQADVFALGKVLYEAATGLDRRQFPQLPPDLRTRPDAHALIELNEILLKACAYNSRERYQSAGEMRADLELLEGGESVKQLHKLQRWWRRALPVAIAAIVLVSLAFGVAVFLGNQAQRFKELADESRQHLVRSHVANGVRLMDENDYSRALVWFTEALKLDAGNPQREDIHRRRIGSLLRSFPKLVALGTHEGGVADAQFSRDGRWIVSASSDHTARVWDANTGEPVTPPLNHDGAVLHAIFNPAGTKILSASEDGTARVWDAKTGQLLARLSHAKAVLCVDWSFDSSRIITGSRDNTARIWDAMTGQPLGTPFAHQDEVRSVAFSPNGQTVLTASADATARLWNSLDGRPVTPALRHQDRVKLAAFSSDGQKVVTATGDGTIQVWNALTGAPLAPALRLAGSIWHAAFSPDGRRVFAGGGVFSKSGEARIWNSETGDPVTPVMRQRLPFKPSAFSPDGRWIVTASEGQAVQVWDATKGEPIGPIMRHNQSVSLATFSPDGRRVLTASRDGTWRLWDLASDAAAAPTIRHTGVVLDTEFSPDGKWIGTASSDGIARIWDAQTLAPVGPPIHCGTIALKVKFSPDSSLFAAVGAESPAKIQNIEAGTVVDLPLRPTGMFRSVSFNRSGREVVTACSDGTAQVWSASSGQPLTPPFKCGFPATDAAFSPDGKLIAVGACIRNTGPGEVRVWDWQKGELISPILPVPGQVDSVSFSPSGRLLLAACSDESVSPRAVQVWDVQTWKPAIPPLKHDDGVPVARFSPDGKKIITGGEDRVAKIWDTATGRQLAPTLHHNSGLLDAGFSPDSKLVATTSLDETARVWDVSTGQPVTPPLSHSGRVHSVRFSLDGDRLLTGAGRQDPQTGRFTKAGTACVWDLSPETMPVEELIKLAQLLSGTQLNENGELAAMEPAALQSLWQQMKLEHPERFSVPPAVVSRWEHEQALDCLVNEQWSAALLHLTHGLELEPANAELRQQADRCREALARANNETGSTPNLREKE